MDGEPIRRMRPGRLRSRTAPTVANALPHDVAKAVGADEENRYRVQHNAPKVRHGFHDSAWMPHDVRVSAVNLHEDARGPHPFAIALDFDCSVRNPVANAPHELFGTEANRTVDIPTRFAHRANPRCPSRARLATRLPMRPQAWPGPRVAGTRGKMRLSPGRFPGPWRYGRAPRPAPARGGCAGSPWPLGQR